MEISRQSKMLCGILLLTIPTIQYGGTYLLQLLTTHNRAYVDNPLRQGMFRAGHAHAGVLVILSLICQLLVDAASPAPGWALWTARLGTPVAAVVTLTLYWVTRTITSSMRDYWDNRWYPVDPTYVSTPTAFGVFAHQTVPEGEPPRSYMERMYNIQRWTVFPRGGHFAPAEEPATVAEDLTAFFHDLS